MRRLSHRNDQARLNRSKRYRTGFTLVELLVVIAIIGVLAGLLVPAVFAVRKTFNNASVKFEVQGLDTAVNNYRSKYGDYPPDGSSWPIMEAHFRKVFPNILQSELQLLNPANNSNNAYIRSDYAGRVMDPAEALVFFLGGFSSDAQRPFTGKGGPFVVKRNTTLYRYNGSRENALYEFSTSRLSLTKEIDVDGAEWYLSSDDSDLLPVFMSYNSTTPYVYFDSRTYQTVRAGSLFCNFHEASAADPMTPVGLMGVARPLLSVTAALDAPYENPKTFQIVSPGIDGLFGWDRRATGSGTPVLFNIKGAGFNPVFANGRWSWVPVPPPPPPLPPIKDFKLPEIHLDQFGRTRFPMFDNVANCIDQPTFSDATK